MIILPTEIKKFTHIVHLADIQIRLTKRHDEYREVFHRLFEAIKTTPETTAICVVGDIVHSKLDLSPECVQVTKEFLVGLSDLRPTILVAGNHDTNLTNKSRLDSLSPIVEAINHPNLFYLKKTDLYSLGDICFNNYSIFDDEVNYLKGDNIPLIYRNEFRYFICLFHGTVDGSVSEMGFKLVNKNMPINFFDGHDIVLLGDIHKTQFLQFHDGKNKPTIHYPGSLIQQNHGEDLEGHGYSLWKLILKTCTRVEIPNDYGYFTIKIDKGEIKTDLTNIPKKVRVRLSCFESLPTETKAVIKEIKKLTILVEPPTYTREITKEQEKRLTTLGVNLVRGDLKNRDHQIKLISEFLKKKLKITNDETINSVIKINDEINEEFKTDDIPKNVRWLPIRFEWDNLFSFGEDNVIDFTKVKDIVGLFASNASGKSSVFSALSWCIFDKCEREFKANNIINDQKMSCRALLEVDIGGIHHFIERTGKMDKKGAVKVNVRFWKIIEGKEEELTGIERSDTNNAIRSHLGNYEDFLLTSLSVQKSGKYETSFIDLGDSGRKDLLAQFMGLTLFDKLHETANKKLNEIISTLKIYKNEDFEGGFKTSVDTLSQIQSAFNVEQQKSTEIQSKKEEIQRKLIEEQTKIIKVEGCSYSSESEITEIINGCKNIISYNQDQLSKIIEYQIKHKNVIDEINENLKSFGDFEELKKKWATWNNLLGSKSDIERVFQLKVSEIKSLKEKVDKVKGYEFDPDCTFCVKNADELILNGKAAEQHLKIYRKDIGEIVEKQLSIKKTLDETAEDEKNYWRYNDLLRDKAKDQELYLKWQKEVENINKKINKANEDLSSVEKQLEIFNKNRDAITNNDITNKNISNFKLQLNSAVFEENKQNQLVRDLSGKISVLESKIEEFSKKIQKIKEIEKIYNAYDLYVQSVCRDGIPYEVICVAVPHIENEVNSILNQIVDFYAKFDVDGKNIVPYIVYDERHWLMSLGSGMEQFILSTAIRVALTNLSNLPKMNGVVIDEGFGVLDPEHLSTISNLFHYLKSNFDFVIIISHLDVMRDLVDSHIEIKKEAGFSKVNFI